MRKLTGVAAVCVAILGGVLVAEDKKLESGLPIGESVPAFNVRDITGPNEGKTLCYRCKYGARPVVTVFTRTINDEVKALVKNIDEQVGKNEDKKMASFVVLITDKADSAEKQLKEIAEKEKIKHVPLTIIDGKSGPPEYKIAEGAEVTVMMWVDSTVKVNEAFAPGKFDKKAVAALTGETKKILE